MDITRRYRWCVALGWMFACCFLLVQPVVTETAVAEETGRVAMTIKRGLTAKFEFTHPSESLRALPDQSIDAPILVRLERMTSPSPTSNPESRYTLSFFGAVAGQYDLADWVVERDGSPLADRDSLPAMQVRIVSQLSPDHGTSLYEIDDPSLAASRGYRALLVAIACAWVVVPVVSGLTWWRSREQAPPAPVAVQPTLADRLRPLVQRASEGDLSVDELSRLELMLYVFWQRRLGLSESLSEALPVMRRDAEAGGLLRTLEAWVHADAPTRPELTTSTLDALLAPYHAMCEDDQRLRKTDPVESAA